MTTRFAVALWLSFAAMSCARAVPVASAAPPARRGSSPLAAVYAKGLEGDMRAGMALLGKIDPALLDEADRARHACFTTTFAQRTLPPVAVQEPLVADAIRAY